MKRYAYAGLCTMLVLLALAAEAHEMRPSLLELSSDDSARISVRFRIAYANGRPMPLTAILPSHCSRIGDVIVADTPPIRTIRWIADCGGRGLSGPVAVQGLADTGTDVIVKTESATIVLRPSMPSVVLVPKGLPVQAQGESVIMAYVQIGLAHIVSGPDHLVFVLGLLMLVGRQWRVLLLTITAFTVAHSVTLAASTLGIVRLASGPVEALIALSIVMLAAQISRADRATYAPWHFAFACGLLHGFGFAGVLGEVGLPAESILGALLGFNLGVELGQLAFVGVLTFSGLLVSRTLLSRARPVLIYGIGTVGAFWFWRRIAPILEGLVA
ncbi:MAG: HupE/UreJ family protein [Myxococcota bacterium]|nr:HupE/UreJ family protein [Myxococcota bacterium]